MRLLLLQKPLSCHPEPFACHSEGAKRLKNLAQDRLREGSLKSSKKRDSSLCSE